MAIKTALLLALFACGASAHAQEKHPVTYAHTQLQWERLDAGTWKFVEQWKSPKMKAGEVHTWDTTVTRAGTTQRLLLRVTWAGDTPRVELEGGFAYLSPPRDPVRLRVNRGLADGQAWIFGVPSSQGLMGHRVVAKVRLETVMEPKKNESSPTR